MVGQVEFTPSAMKVLEKRYLTRDENGNLVESPEEMFRRVARAVARADEDPVSAEEIFFGMMARLEFLPNSPTLMNAGKELGQLSACFVLPVYDSLESIFEAVKYAAIIHKSGGGTGFSFSRLRPVNSVVASTGGFSSGPVSFMRVFDTAADVVKQGGKRRGANMGVLRVDHPDILEFIHAKKEPGQFVNFNLSVAVTDAFMGALERDGGYELVDPHTGRVTKTIPAKKVWDEIVEQAWKTGEPGVLFIDRINRCNPTPYLGEFESTNPCGEQPLLPYESCNLGSINLAKLVKRNGGGWVLDEERLDVLVKDAVRFLDNVIEINRFPLPQIEVATKLNRKVGLGVMGFADLLISLGIPYNSSKGMQMAYHVMRRIQEKARESSMELARSRGPFPNFPKSVYARRGMVPLRNATLTTIAPTGTLSIIAGCTSGIEPLFAVCYVRKALDNDELREVHPQFVEEMKKRGLYREELMEQIAATGSVRGLSGIPEQISRIFVTAHDVSPEWHVMIQAAFQEHTDNAVSKTVNFPHSATPEDVARVYRMAYRLGCKGITIYRDRCRDSQVLNIGRHVQQEPVKVKTQKEDEGPLHITPRPRPSITRGSTERIGTGCGKLYVTVNHDNEDMCEVFAQMGKSGGCAASQIEAISRLISLALRSRVSVGAVIRQIKGIRCPNPQWVKGRMVLSCADGIAKVLERHIEGNGQVQPPTLVPGVATPTGMVAGACPECGGALQHTEGCVVCGFCGFAKCV